MSSLGNAEILGKNLRRYIEQSGKMDKEIAEAVGVSAATITEWTKGRKYPRINKIEALARYFHIQKSDLIEEYHEEEPGTHPVTKEARILAGGIDKLPKEQREQAIAVVRAMFAQYADFFADTTSDDK